MTLSELLAISTDGDHYWRNGNLERAAKTLAPRPVDDGKKSAWAHFAEGDDNPSDEVVGDPRQATRKLQALALFVFASAGGPTRSRIRGIALSRDCLPFGLIEDAQPHPIAAYRETHRSLLPPSEGEECRAAVKSILLSNGCETWKYTRDDLRLLLTNLLARGVITGKWRHTAEALLTEWAQG